MPMTPNYRVYQVHAGRNGERTGRIYRLYEGNEPVFRSSPLRGIIPGKKIQFFIRADQTVAVWGNAPL